MRKSILYSCFSLFASALFFSCTEVDFTIGKSIQPDRDVVWSGYSEFPVSSSTVLVDSILQRSSTAMLGEFTDHRFGTTKADFITQFYCHEDFTFGDNVIDNRIDSVFLYLFFNTCYGDSLSLFEASVYQLNKAPDPLKLYYTNVRIEEFCDRSLKLGKSIYTPASSSNKWNSLFTHCVRIPLDRAFGQSIYDDWLSHPEYFATPEAFTEYLKGFYVTTHFGNGAMINVSQMELELIYKYLYQNTDSTGTVTCKDTIAASYFSSTKELRQINTYSHPDLSSYIPTDTAAGSDVNYIYAPAGMYTRIELPLDDIYEKLKFTNINYARIMLTATDLDDSQWGMNPPDKLLLIREDDVNSFFAGFNLTDNLYSFLSTYDASDTCFVFEVTAMIQKFVRKMDGNELGKDFNPYDRLLVVPVSQISNTENTPLYLLPAVLPQAVKIRSADHPDRPMIFEVVSSKQNI